MKKFQLFYDYECPYCKKGYETLIKLLPLYPQVEIEWRPIEAHPKPEDHHPHTDLAVMSFYIAIDLGADMDKYHALMYQAISIERRNVEDPEILFNIIKNLVDRNKFMELLGSGKYTFRAEENNDLAYEKEDVWFVPAFRAGSLKLDSKGSIGVSNDEVKDFLNKLTGSL